MEILEASSDYLGANFGSLSESVQRLLTAMSQADPDREHDLAALLVLETFEGFPVSKHGEFGEALDQLREALRSCNEAAEEMLDADPEMETAVLGEFGDSMERFLIALDAQEMERSWRI